MAVDVAELLSRELGAERVIGPSSDRLEDYGRDESYLGAYPPDCAVLCATTEQVVAVMKLAKEHRIPVTPRGAGSGMVGGALAVRGGIVLSTEKMTRITDIDAEDLVVCTEPGVFTGELQTAVEEQGLFYPPDPASLEFCSIGGNVATNAGGPRAFKYGVTREYVIGLEVVLMGGEVLRCGRRTSKGVTGYDLVAGFVGSEGTFGVVTDLTLKLLPKPSAVQTILAVFPDLAAAGEAISAILHKGFRPRTLEIADRMSIDAVRGKTRYKFPANAGGIALIELDGEEEGLEDAMLRVGQMCDDYRAIDVLVAQGESERRSLWDARRNISPGLRESCRLKINEDICVPRGAIPEMLARVDALSAKHGFPIATFGHAGDGNLHVNTMVEADPDDPEVKKRIKAVLVDLFQTTIDLRGTMSGEHGIGLAKRDYMPLEQSEQILEWQRKWKKMWDPDELLNPGKVLPPRQKRCHE